MASIIDSIKNVAGDSHPFFKMTGFSVIVFLVMQLNTFANVLPELKITANILTILGFLGFTFLSVHNAVNENNIVLPNLFNPIKLIWVGAKGFISLLPFAALVYFGITWLIPLLTFEPWINYLVLIAAFLVLSSFFVVSMLLFSKNLQPLASYNFKYIFKYAGDFMAYNFVLALNLLILVGIIFFPIGFGVEVMFGYGQVFTYFSIFTIIFVVMCAMQFYAQLYFEFIALGDT